MRGIYGIRHIESGCIYVGSGVKIPQRWKEHLSDLRRGEHVNRRLQRAWDKYGESAFEFFVIEPVDTPEMLLIREQYWIDRYWGRDTCFNLNPTAGSTLGRERSAEERESISAGRKRFLETEDGRASIEQFKGSMAGKWTGWPGNASDRRKEVAKREYVFTDPSGHTCRYFGNLKDFCTERGLDTSTMLKVFNGDRPSHKGWRKG